MAQVLSEIVEVCVFRRAKRKTEYLLLRRTASDNLYGGIWQIVTGTLNPNESSLDAARRELSEETGVQPKRFWKVPFVDAFLDPKKDAIQLAPVFAAEVPASASVKLSDEHQDLQWLTYAAAKHRLVWPGQREALAIVQKYIVGVESAGELLEMSNS